MVILYGGGGSGDFWANEDMSWSERRGGDWRRGKAREGRELAISNSRHPPYATHWIPHRVETFNGEIICATDVDKVKRT